MRTALLSDIHGNLAALDAVLADADAHGAETIIAAGDHLATGPRPVEVFELLQERKAIMIRGNNDGDLLAARRGDRVPEHWAFGFQFAPLRWSAGALTDAVLNAIETMPEQRTVYLGTASPIRVVHGSPRNVREPVLPVPSSLAAEVGAVTGFPPASMPIRPLAEVLADVPEPVMVCGHSHKAWQARLDGQLAVNPGSVGVPNNETREADYALLSWDGRCWQAELRSVPYDLARLQADYEESGLYEAGGPIGRAFLADTLSAHCLVVMFFWHARALARQAGLDEHGPLPDEIWIEAEQTFDRAAAAAEYLQAYRRLAAALAEAGQGVA